MINLLKSIENVQPLTTLKGKPQIVALPYNIVKVNRIKDPGTREKFARVWGDVYIVVAQGTEAFRLLDRFRRYYNQAYSNLIFSHLPQELKNNTHTAWKLAQAHPYFKPVPMDSRVFQEVLFLKHLHIAHEYNRQSTSVKKRKSLLNHISPWEDLRVTLSSEYSEEQKKQLPKELLSFLKGAQKTYLIRLRLADTLERVLHKNEVKDPEFEKLVLNDNFRSHRTFMKYVNEYVNTILMRKTSYYKVFNLVSFYEIAKDKEPLKKPVITPEAYSNARETIEANSYVAHKTAETIKRIFSNKIAQNERKQHLALPTNP